MNTFNSFLFTVFKQVNTCLQKYFNYFLLYIRINKYTLAVKTVPKKYLMNLFGYLNAFMRSLIFTICTNSCLYDDIKTL